MQFRNGHFGTVRFGTNKRTMKFYNRQSELSNLKEIRNKSLNNAQMTFVMGRRRIGKTKLLLEATKSDPTLYFFVTRKSETLLCADYIDEIREKLAIPIYGEITHFATLFQILLEHSKQNPFNLIIDEFQEFISVNSSVYGDIQRLWDLYKDESRINLLLCGSIYSLMHKIFEDSKEPLFGRANNRILLNPFSPSVLKEILSDYSPEYTNEDLLALYAFTGGIPKYVELLLENNALTFSTMVDYLVQPNSLFFTEGKTLLIEEFGKDYATYFSILSCIANGINSRPTIEGILQREISGHITRLEHDFGLIRKRTPLFSKSETKNVKYEIDDCPLRFWFRFIYKYAHFIEVGAYEQLKSLIIRDYPTFSGKTLESYFKMQYIETKEFTSIGGFWDKKGEHEIDMIALNELTHKGVVAEIKRKKENINLKQLQQKAAFLCKDLSPYDIEYRALSLEDM